MIKWSHLVSTPKVKGEIDIKFQKQISITKDIN